MMFLLFHIGSVLILTMAGSLFLFISVVAFIASRQQWECILVLAWLRFESMVVLHCTVYAYKGCKKKCFAICDQTVFLSPSSFAVHFARHFCSCWFSIVIIFIPPSSISKLNTFLFIFSNALLLLYFLFHQNLYMIMLMRVSTLCVKASKEEGGGEREHVYVPVLSLIHI